MDACKSDQSRQPLVPSKRNNAATTATSRGPRTREVSSRYKSPSRTSNPTSAATRCSSPTLSRTGTGTGSSPLVPKRAQSAERKRPSMSLPSTPVNDSIDMQLASRKATNGRLVPSRPSTPVNESIDMQIASKKGTNGRSGDGLWPSTMRSLSVSFQSDTISIPVPKKEKPVSNSSVDRSLRPSSNVAALHKQVEKNRSPLNGKNLSNQSENSKPADAVQSRLIDQHRWPSRMVEKVSSGSLNRSLDLTDKSVRTSIPVTGFSALRRMSSEGLLKPLQKSASDAAVRARHLDGGSNGGDAEANSLAASGRSQLLPGSRQPSPRRISSVVPSSFTRGVSPSRTVRQPSPSRGNSPSRSRSSNPSSAQSNTSSVLSFIVDVQKGKRAASYIEDAHQLRLLYNRYLQWRFSNALADDVLCSQKITAEETLFNVWKTTLNLWDSVMQKRISLQQMNLGLKLNAVLSAQMPDLEKWTLLERDHICSLAGAVEDLESSTLRLPVTSGARADVESLKFAVSSAVDVMQATGFATRSLLSGVEDAKALVSELAAVAAHEKAMLNECEALLAATAAMQVQDSSLKTHILQLRETLEKGRGQFWQSMMIPP